MGLLSRGNPCADCGSSDALAYYGNDDGSQWSVCFSCDKRRQVEGEKKVKAESSEGKFEQWLEQWRELRPLGIMERAISTTAVKNYGVVTTKTHHAYPYFTEDSLEPVAFKVRRVADKRISWSGDPANVLLFGQQRFGNHKRGRVVVVEGELDARAVSQMFGDKVPVVSIKSGAQGAAKDVKSVFTWLDRFEEIVLCFDADEPGREASKDVADVFAGKIRVMKLDPKVGKDACDYLMAGKSKEFENLYWSASVYEIEGVLSYDDMRELLQHRVPDKMGTYPWEKLQGMTEGFRPSELITITAGSGLGKSCVLREIVMHVHDTTDHKIGCLFMEEDTRRTIEGMMSIDLDTPLHRDTRAVERYSKEYWDSFERVYGDRNLFVMDASFDTGASVDDIVGRVRYLCKAIDCKIVFLDHISLLVSAGQHGDERKALDEIMTKLRTLTQDTGIALFIVSHLKRPDGKGHEEGAVTSISQLRGSAAIGQLSDFVIGLERNGQAEDEVERNTTHIRVLKNRVSGITGPAGALLYDTISGRLKETTPITLEEAL